MQKQLKSQQKKAPTKSALKTSKRKVATAKKPVKAARKAPVKQQKRTFFGSDSTSQANKAAGKKFLEEQFATGNYHQHPQGFIYRFTTEGQTGKGQSNNSSPKPKVTDSVMVHYEGKTIDGTVFDSSYRRGEPITFPLGNVIKGWQLALAEMSHGDKLHAIFPSDICYGDRGAGSVIKPGATLCFDVEYLAPQLTEVQKAGNAFYQKAKASGQYQEHPAGFLYKYTGEAPAPNAPKPTMRDEVTVHYEGRNVAGKVFDSSYQRGSPTKFPLDGVVPGFAIPISQLMTKGTKIQVIIPPELAYQDQAVSPLIPAHSTLTFDIELLLWGQGHRF